MSKTFKISTLILCLGVMLTFECRGMYIAKMVYKKTGAVARHWMPIAVVALSIYMIYHRFSILGRIDKNAKDASDGIKRVEHKVIIIDEKVDQANAGIVKLENGVEILQQDTQELKKGNKDLKEQIRLFEGSTNTQFTQVRHELKGSINELHQLIKKVQYNVRGDLENLKQLLLNKMGEDKDQLLQEIIDSKGRLDELIKMKDENKELIREIKDMLVLVLGAKSLQMQE